MQRRARAVRAARRRLGEGEYRRRMKILAQGATELTYVGYWTLKPSQVIRRSRCARRTRGTKER
mgnify:CR=1 FL=1